MLRHLTAAALIPALLLAQPVAAGAGDVDPMIGTGGDGHTFPGAVAPFGMVQLSPDTDVDRLTASATYNRAFNKYNW